VLLEKRPAEIAGKHWKWATGNTAFVLFKMWWFKSWLFLIAEEHRQAATENYQTYQRVGFSCNSFAIRNTLLCLPLSSSHITAYRLQFLSETMEWS